MSNKKNSVGLVKRLVIIFYDSVLLVAVVFFAAILFAVPLGITMEHPLYPLFVVYIYLVGFVFLGWCWTHGGQTLGLKTWKIKLVSNEGGPVTWKAAFIRYIGSMICWLGLGVGFLWCYTNKKRLAWNDLMSKTRLVKIEN